ncbi:phosphatase [Verticillium alfalfae VaMs.102]|uniref:Phosphatase n=1 Tax=Verticillium alfalfae (strain VaMs.102 / ATCC MYA-4576 / FGSC 10136) TaxID=526221 RepID=C9SK98_VERA1|nr:phosphatase [Verticillium alfalfae VaMs.102]EEY19116.1 phosphatase [Verticillium alfalfae VaMs.102]
MHRAATRALRTTYRCTARTLTRSSRRGLLLPQQPSAAVAYGARHYHRNPARSPQHAGHAIEPLKSSMYIRRFSAALRLRPRRLRRLVHLQRQRYRQRQHDAVARKLCDDGPVTPQPRRGRCLVIGAGELHTGAYVGEGPISKTTGNDGKRVVEMITPDQATEKLRKTEQSYFVNRGQGVLRYDLVQLPSNDPIEDDHAEKIVEVPGRNGASDVPNSDWMFWGVFDGHSQRLATPLPPRLSRPPSRQVSPSSTTRLSTRVLKRFSSLAPRLWPLSSSQPALSGSCALLSFYDSRSKLLRVACTGDSRAVLGRRSDSGKWTATALSVDQTAATPTSRAHAQSCPRARTESSTTKASSAVSNRQKTFGDATYKWSRDISMRLRQAFFGRTPSPLLKTPPYVTAEPVVTTTKVNPENGDFLVLATDGLWEMLTNEEVVGLVGKWIETQASGSSSNSQFDSTWARIFGSGNKPQLPVEHAKGQDVGGQKTPIRLQQWGISPDAPERFCRQGQERRHAPRAQRSRRQERGSRVTRASNAARPLFPTVPVRRPRLPPFAPGMPPVLLVARVLTNHVYSDDLTVQVIFFGNGSKTGEVVANLEATAPEEPVKAKL